jgi:hypothetical protein
MDGGLVTVLKVLDVFFDVTRGVDREDVAVASVVVEGIAINCVRGLLCGQEEYGAGFGIGVIRFGW